jgi:hypothetical protein
LEDEFLCLTVVSQPGESESAFAARLSEFWTKMLREFPDDFEKVYAETIEFEEDKETLTRQYLCEESAIDVVTRELKKGGIDHQEIDPDDKWSKYEAAPTEWWQIEH